MRLLVYLFLTLCFTSISWTQGAELTLEQFLKRVQAESPDLAVQKANVEAAKARANGIRINPPMAGLMQMREGDSVRGGYEISQEIPFPTKISQDKKVRDLELEVVKENNQYQRILILSEARNAYISYWSAFERHQILKDKFEWLKHHVKLARASTRADSSAQLHLLEVESELDTIENEVLDLEANLEEKKAELRIFAPSLNTDSLTPHEPPLQIVEVEGLKASPAVLLKEKEFTSKQAAESLKKQSYAPDFFLRLRSFEGNGMAPRNQEIMVGISLPFLYFWQPKAEMAEATAQRMMAEAELQKSKVEFEARLKSFTKKASTLKAQLANLKNKLIPRAERRKRLVTTLSTRTMEGLDQHRSVMIALLDLRAKTVELRVEYENTFKEILKLTGVEAKVGAL